MHDLREEERAKSGRYAFGNEVISDPKSGQCEWGITSLTQVNGPMLVSRSGKGRGIAMHGSLYHRRRRCDDLQLKRVEAVLLSHASWSGSTSELGALQVDCGSLAASDQCG